MPKQIMYFSGCPLQKPSKELTDIVRSVKGVLQEKTISEGLPGKVVLQTNSCNCDVDLQFSKEESDWAPLKFNGEQQSKKCYKCTASYTIEDVSKQQQKQIENALKPYQTKKENF